VLQVQYLLGGESIFCVQSHIIRISHLSFQFLILVYLKYIGSHATTKLHKPLWNDIE